MKIKSSFAHYVHPLTGAPSDYDALMDQIANASVVLLGEASHGTHEFYAARAAISKRLIEEKGFATILIEADWPDTHRVNQYINGEGQDKNAEESLNDFKRFPAWMWRNEEVVSFIEWLRRYNEPRMNMQSPVHIYGLDLYSLHRSIEIIIHTLEKINPEAAHKAKLRYQCFDTYADPQEYGYAASLFPDKSCRDEVIEQLIDLKKKQFAFFKHNTIDPVQEKLYLEQNALVVQNAEKYYTAMFEPNAVTSWNVRDSHMMETVNKIVSFNDSNERNHKIIIWAHNSHVGDVRYTQMFAFGEQNLGQFVKEAFGADALSVGFTTYQGTVSAASAWGGDVERKKVRPALSESIESFFHDSGIKDFLLIPSAHPEMYEFLERTEYLERAIGVIYLPETERKSHYFYAQLSQQFDAVIHFDQSTAVVPLEKSTRWQKGEDVPETFPFGV